MGRRARLRAFLSRTRLRAAVATPDPKTLPEFSTWYITTNLPLPGTAGSEQTPFEPANLEEVVRLYGLEAWVEQSYKQVKHELSWADSQVRSDVGIRRHWALVCCAFCFCWWALPNEEEPDEGVTPVSGSDSVVEASATERGKTGREHARGWSRPRLCWPAALRRMRAWLTPWVWITRWWIAWSDLPPPEPLAELLEWLAAGNPIRIYSR